MISVKKLKTRGFIGPKTAFFGLFNGLFLYINCNELLKTEKRLVVIFETNLQTFFTCSGSTPLVLVFLEKFFQPLYTGVNLPWRVKTSIDTSKPSEGPKQRTGKMLLNLTLIRQPCSVFD